MSESKGHSDTGKEMSAGAKVPAGKKDSCGKAKGDVTRALRSVYDSTLEEDVPPEFLDLLGKLS